MLSFIGSLHADSEIDELKKQVCLVLPSLEGWCSREKALNFIDLVLEVKPQVCVEIGVFGGSSLFPVASALKHRGEGIVIGIDPWDNSSVSNILIRKKMRHNLTGGAVWIYKRSTKVC